MEDNKTSENKIYIRKYLIKFGEIFSNSSKNILKNNEPLEILSEFIYYDNNKKTIEDLKEFVCDLLNYSCCPCNIKICSNKVDKKSPPYKKSLKFYEEDENILLSKLNLQNSFYIVQLTDIECNCSYKFKELFKLTKMKLIKILYMIDKSKEENKENRNNILYYDIEQKNLKLNQNVDDLLIDELFIAKIARPENEIQMIGEFNIDAKERPENVVEGINSIEIIALEKEPLVYQLVKELLIEAVERPENVYQQINEIELVSKDRPENITEQIDEIELLAKERPENIVEQIDEIELQARERPENIFDQLDEIELFAKDRPENIFEQIDEIVLLSKDRPENIFEQLDEIELLAKDRPINIFEQIDEIELLAKDRPEKRIEDFNLNLKNINNTYYSRPILYENFQKINESIGNSICKIKLKNGSEGLGFFCKIPFLDKNNLMPVLITKNLIISKEIIENKETLKIKVGNSEIDISLINIIKYSNERCELTIIEMKEPNEEIIHYFELDEKIIESIINEDDNNEIDFNEILYTIEYHANKFYISLGTLSNIKFNINIKNNENSLLNIYPLININNNKLMGIYEENIDNINFSDTFVHLIKEFIETKYYVLNAIKKCDITEKKEIIGKGAFGTVYLIENNNKKYALKKIPLIIIEKEDLINYEKEAKILSKLDNEYIVKYYDSFKDKDYLNIIMQYGGKTNLKKFIMEYRDKNQLIEEKIINDIIFQIYIGIKEIHKSNIIHRDLKPENIFIDDKNKILIGDFGISKILEANKKYASTRSGTFEYMAPEIIKGEKYDKKVDIYALGCIIYELFTLNVYYLDKIINEKECKINLDLYPKKWQELIDLLLKKDYHKRPDIDEVDKYLNKNEIILTLEIE